MCIMDHGTEYGIASVRSQIAFFSMFHALYCLNHSDLYTIYKDENDKRRNRAGVFFRCYHYTDGNKESLRLRRNVFNQSDNLVSNHSESDDLL